MNDTLLARIPALDLSSEHDTLWDELTAAVQRVMRSGQFIMGPDVMAFEAEVADYLGARHAIGVNSGTDALVISLRALGIGPGDEVITTPFSFFATAESIGAVGARPVFVDIEEESFNLDPERLEEAITERTAAIMPVHLYGKPAAMDEIMEVAAAHGLKVVEDCAQSFGARHRGRQTGTIGHAGAYSFFPSKNLGAFGDGGLIATDDDEVAEAARMLRVHGAQKKYHNEMLGYNSRLDTLQAAILRVKLPHVDAWNAGRREVARRYGERFAGVAGVVAPVVHDEHVFHQYTVRVKGVDRNAVQATLRARGIDTMVYYPIPQDRLPVYDGAYGRFDVSEAAASEVLSLPMWPSLAVDVQRRVATEIEGAMASALASAPPGTAQRKRV